MSYEPVYFDHIEVHVQDIPKYGEFLIKLFRGGRVRQISDSGTSMFISPDGARFELKQANAAAAPAVSGFCLPCIRLANARAHIEEHLGLTIDKTTDNPDGKVFFFRDAEGVSWHAKDYVHADAYVNW